MPVDFLTEEQEQRYGCYTSEPSPAQLTRYFHLDDADRERIAACRGTYNKLGYALQLGTVRFLDTFLTNPIDAPAGAIRFLATQLGLSETTDLEPYREGRQRWEHANEIKEAYGYRDFQTQPDLFRLTRWLYTRAWLSAERPIVLFDLTTARLVEHKILLPGVSVLERLVASVRDHAQERLWHVLAQIPTAEQRYLLETLLIVPQGERQTPLDRLRRAPTRITAPALVSALRRIDAVRLLGVHNVDLSFVPANRIKALARYVLSVFLAAIVAPTPLSNGRRKKGPLWKNGPFWLVKSPSLTHAKEKCYHIFIQFKSDTFFRILRKLMTMMQVFNTRGAARRLGCSETWIHKLVAQGKLRAYTYDEDGELVERRKDRKSQGRGLYFFAKDVDQYQPAVQRRPRGSKNKKLPTPDTSSKTA